MKYRRVLIKLSGEALSTNGKHGIIDIHALQETAKIITSIARKGVEVTLVVGAGNICRGLAAEQTGLNRVTADYMGMLGTVINSLALMDAIKKQGLKSVVLSAVEILQFCETYSPQLANEYLQKGYVVVFGGGTGKPFFSTDTCAALRAFEVSADAILMAKNGVEGIYSDDPRFNKEAKLFKSITYSEIILKQLKVMDLSAIQILKDKDIDVRVFNNADPNNIVRVIEGEDIGTVIKKG